MYNQSFKNSIVLRYIAILIISLFFQLELDNYLFAPPSFALSGFYPCLHHKHYFRLRAMRSTWPSGMLCFVKIPHRTCKCRWISSVIPARYMTPVMQCTLLLSPGEVMSSVTPEWTEKQQEWLTGKQTDWGGKVKWNRASEWPLKIDVPAWNFPGKRYSQIAKSCSHM